MIAAAPMPAQSRELTPFIGWMEGGAVELDGEDTGIDGAFVGGLTLSFARGVSSQLDFTVAHTDSSAARRDPFEPPVTSDVTLDYFHLGGRYLFHPRERVDPYIGITAGGTRLAMRGSNGLAFSASYGGGVDLRMTETVALRLDGRFYTTLGTN